MANGLTTVHHDYEGSFTTEKIDQKLEEGIDRKGLNHWSAKRCRHCGIL
jgi:hypothetical protein